MSESFMAALAAYPTTAHPGDEAKNEPRLSAADRAHLKRWAEDERADKVWSTINSAAKRRGRLLPVRFFIQEILGAREIAKSIDHRKKNRARYLKRAAQMMEVAGFLREPIFYGLPLIPSGPRLARMLDEAARTYRDYVAVSRNEGGGLKWSRQSKPIHVFMRQVSDDLKEMTGRWLDHEVAILTEIAFNNMEIDDDQVLWVRRGIKRSKFRQKANEKAN